MKLAVVKLGKRYIVNISDFPYYYSTGLNNKDCPMARGQREQCSGTVVRIVSGPIRPVINQCQKFIICMCF